MTDPLQVKPYLDLRAETQARDRGLKEKVMSLEEAAALVADDDQGRKAKALAALDGLRHPVDRDQAIGEFRVLFARLAAAPAIVTFCHQAFLHIGRDPRR